MEPYTFGFFSSTGVIGEIPWENCRAIHDDVVGLDDILSVVRGEHRLVDYHFNLRVNGFNVSLPDCTFGRSTSSVP